MFLLYQMCIIKRDFRQFNKMKLKHSGFREQSKFMNYILGGTGAQRVIISMY